MNVPCEINLEAACKNQHCHSAAGEESCFNFWFLLEIIHLHYNKQYREEFLIEKGLLKRLIVVSSVMPKTLVKSEETSKKNEVLEKKYP